MKTDSDCANAQPDLSMLGVHVRRYVFSRSSPNIYFVGTKRKKNKTKQNKKIHQNLHGD